MKKLTVLFIVFSSFSIKVLSQIQSISAGAITAVKGETEFNGPFKKNYNLFASLSGSSKKAYYSLMYSFGGNAIGTVDGVYLNKTWDAYFAGFKDLHTTSGYLGLGIEKMYPLSNDSRIFLFVELGTNFQFNKKIFQTGVLLSISSKLWKKK